jgi:hypothetical protein
MSNTIQILKNLAVTDFDAVFRGTPSGKKVRERSREAPPARILKNFLTEVKI